MTSEQLSEVERNRAVGRSIQRKLPTWLMLNAANGDPDALEDLGWAARVAVESDELSPGESPARPAPDRLERKPRWW